MPPKKNIAKKGSAAATKPEHKDRKGKKEESSYKNQWKSFADQLRSLGLRLRVIEPDGNCMFRSIADQDQGNQSKHSEYRQKIVQFMRENPDDFQPFVMGDWNAYLAKMDKDGTWGGHLELSAASRALQVNITIHQLNAPRLDIRNQGSPTARTFHLSYHNHEHYSSVRDLSDVAQSGATDIDLESRLKAAETKDGTSSSRDWRNDAPRSKAERIVMELTGCANLPYVRVLLSENWNDVDAVVEMLYAEQAMGDVGHWEEGVPVPPRESSLLEQKSPPPPQQPSSPSAPAPPPGNNSPCPCKSGKKFGKCCKAEQRMNEVLSAAYSEGNPAGSRSVSKHRKPEPKLTNKQRKEQQKAEKMAEAAAPRREQKDASANCETPVADFGSLQI